MVLRTLFRRFHSEFGALCPVFRTISAGALLLSACIVAHAEDASTAAGSPPAAAPPPPPAAVPALWHKCSPAVLATIADIAKAMKPQAGVAMQGADRSRYVQQLIPAVSGCEAAAQAFPKCQWAVSLAVDELFASVRKAGTGDASQEELDKAARHAVVYAQVCGKPTPEADVCRDAVSASTLQLAGLIADDPTHFDADAAKKIAETVQGTCTALEAAKGKAASIAQNETMAAMKQQICAQKLERLSSLLDDYYGVSPQLAEQGPAESALTIERVTVGDHVHGHTCDATSWMRGKCLSATTTQPSDANTSAGPNFCLLRTGNARTEACGYDPSPQADLTVHVTYSCGDGVPRRLSRPVETSRIDLVCGSLGSTPGPPTQRTAEQIQLEVKFFAAEPCPIEFQKAK